MAIVNDQVVCLEVAGVHIVDAAFAIGPTQ